VTRPGALRRRGATGALALVALVGLAALAGCGGGTGGQLANPVDTLGRNDINPRPRDQVRDGGDLRLPLQSMPANFNPDEVDGATGDLLRLSRAILPAPFLGTADGGLRLGTDLLSSAAVTSTAPQVVTYTINPKASWTDGTPITWRDFAAYWHACSGADPAFQTATTTGYQNIRSVTRGADDRQAVVTFGTPFAEWKSLFDPFLPSSLTGTPAGFNAAWRTGVPVSAGPFEVSAVDQTNQTVTLVRNPRWWGTPPKLNRVIFKVYEQSAEPDALANNELDYYDIGQNVDLFRRGRAIPGAAVRQAPSRVYWEVTLNGAPGAPLADPALRRAIAQGIDARSIAERLIGPIVPGAGPDGNHFYVPGTADYRDNSAVLPYDPAAANHAMDALGWPRTGPTRQRDGRPLTLRMMYADSPTNLDIVKSVQSQLGQLGVTVVPQAYSGPDYDRNLTGGNFDLVTFGWQSTPTPLSSSLDVYATVTGDNVRENYGRVFDPKIDALFAQGLAELDDTRRAAIGDQLDRLVWAEAHDVPLFARPGAVVVRANLVNFGAFGFADFDYIDAGFA
jgi:peptide/nickel transport system substrate-binding protein